MAYSKADRDADKKVDDNELAMADKDPMARDYVIDKITGMNDDRNSKGGINNNRSGANNRYYEGR